MSMNYKDCEELLYKEAGIGTAILGAAKAIKPAMIKSVNAVKPILSNIGKSQVASNAVNIGKSTASKLTSTASKAFQTIKPVVEPLKPVATKLKPFVPLAFGVADGISTAKSVKTASYDYEKTAAISREAIKRFIMSPGKAKAVSNAASSAAKNSKLGREAASAAARIASNPRVQKARYVAGKVKNSKAYQFAKGGTFMAALGGGGAYLENKSNKNNPNYKKKSVLGEALYGGTVGAVSGAAANKLSESIKTGRPNNFKTKLLDSSATGALYGGIYGVADTARANIKNRNNPEYEKKNPLKEGVNQAGSGALFSAGITGVGAGIGAANRGVRNVARKTISNIKNKRA